MSLVLPLGHTSIIVVKNMVLAALWNFGGIWRPARRRAADFRGDTPSQKKPHFFIEMAHLAAAALFFDVRSHVFQSATCLSLFGSRSGATFSLHAECNVGRMDAA